MTEDEINRKINCIREFARDNDDELAHSAEDVMVWEFIRYISRESRIPVDIKNKVNLILTSPEIEFARWCA